MEHKLHGNRSEDNEHVTAQVNNGKITPCLLYTSGGCGMDCCEQVMYKICMSPVFLYSIIQKHVIKIKLTLWVGNHIKMCYISSIRESKLTEFI